MKSLHPLALKYLAEYPTGSSHYFAAPAETDAMGWVYRKDWFDDPAEKDAFKAKYKRELAVPETWEEFRDVAEFFTRPDSKRYGNVLVTGRGYDDDRDGLRAVPVRLRRRVGRPEDDEGPGRARLGGRGQGAGLLQDAAQVLAARRQQVRLWQGARAVREQLVGDGDELLRVLPGHRPRRWATRSGFFAMPRHGGTPFASLGGQGIRISTKAPPAQQEKAKKFIAWFLKTEKQKKWVARSRAASPPTPRSSRATRSGRRARTTRPSPHSLDHRPGFLERPVLQRAHRVRGAAARRGARRQEVAKDALAMLAKEHEKILSQAE